MSAIRTGDHYSVDPRMIGRFVEVTADSSWGTVFHNGDIAACALGAPGREPGVTSANVSDWLARLVAQLPRMGLMR